MVWINWSGSPQDSGSFAATGGDPNFAFGRKQYPSASAAISEWRMRGYGSTPEVRWHPKPGEPENPPPEQIDQYNRGMQELAQASSDAEYRQYEAEQRRQELAQMPRAEQRPGEIGIVREGEVIQTPERRIQSDNRGGYTETRYEYPQPVTGVAKDIQALPTVSTLASRNRAEPPANEPPVFKYDVKYGRMIRYDMYPSFSKQLRERYSKKEKEISEYINKSPQADPFFAGATDALRLIIPFGQTKSGTKVIESGVKETRDKPLTSAANIAIAAATTKGFNALTKLPALTAPAKAVGVGLTGIYGADVSYRVATASNKAEEYGKIIGTELIPFAIGGSIASRIKLKPISLPSIKKASFGVPSTPAKDFFTSDKLRTLKNLGTTKPVIATEKVPDEWVKAIEKGNRLRQSFTGAESPIGSKGYSTTKKSTVFTDAEKVFANALKKGAERSTSSFGSKGYKPSTSSKDVVIKTGASNEDVYKQWNAFLEARSRTPFISYYGEKPSVPNTYALYTEGLQRLQPATAKPKPKLKTLTREHTKLIQQLSTLKVAKSAITKSKLIIAPLIAISPQTKRAIKAKRAIKTKLKTGLLTATEVQTILRTLTKTVIFPATETRAAVQTAVKQMTKPAVQVKPQLKLQTEVKAAIKSMTKTATKVQTQTRTKVLPVTKLKLKMPDGTKITKYKRRRKSGSWKLRNPFLSLFGVKE